MTWKYIQALSCASSVLYFCFRRIFLTLICCSLLVAVSPVQLSFSSCLPIHCTTTSEFHVVGHAGALSSVGHWENVRANHLFPISCAICDYGAHLDSVPSAAININDKRKAVWYYLFQRYCNTVVADWQEKGCPWVYVAVSKLFWRIALTHISSKVFEKWTSWWQLCGVSFVVLPSSCLPDGPSFDFWKCGGSYVRLTGMITVLQEWSRDSGLVASTIFRGIYETVSPGYWKDFCQIPYGCSMRHTVEWKGLHVLFSVSYLAPVLLEGQRSIRRSRGVHVATV